MNIHPEKIILPEDVRIIINKLEEAGYKAYAAGGCIRDSLLGRDPQDWDIASSAPPQKVTAVFNGRRTILTGMKHGTVTLVLNGVNYEITTFRTETLYSDGRRPDSVVFTNNLYEDLSRRDFTVNAMAFNETEGLVDPFNGQEDLEKKVLRCVGDPSARFSEDALRMLRAVRLSAQLGFTVESAAYDAIKANAPLLGRISAERIASEFNAILMSDRPETIYLLVDTGLISHIAPEFEACISTRQDSRYHSHNVGEHTVRSVALAEKDLIQRMSLFLHDIGKPFSISTDEKGGRHFSGHAAVSAEIADKILKRLKYPRKFSVMVRKLVLNHDIKFKNDDFCIRKLLAQYGEELLFRLIRIREADIGAQNPEFAGERLGRLAKFKESAERIIGEGACTSLERLAVKGSDLAAAGVTEEGRIIGEILGRLLDAVIEKPSLNEKDKLLELAASIKSEE